LRDEDIDTSDIPVRDFSKGVRGRVTKELLNKLRDEKV
jgi:hypothetical protein